MHAHYGKKSILAALLSCLCASVAAEWSQVSQDARGTTYGDRNTVRRNGDGATIWMLYDADIPELQRENEYAHSSRIQFEYNCREHTARILNVVYYAQRMAAGKVVLVRSTPQDWELIAPNTGKAALFNLACARSR